MEILRNIYVYSFPSLSIRRGTEHNHLSWSSSFMHFNKMFSIQTLGSAASLLILLAQNATSAHGQHFCQISELLFQFHVWLLLCSSGATFTSRGICQAVCSISPFKGSCIRCRSAYWHQASGMETTVRTGHSTELQLKAGLGTCAKGFLSHQQQIYPEPGY